MKEATIFAVHKTSGIILLISLFLNSANIVWKTTFLEKFKQNKFKSCLNRSPSSIYCSCAGQRS
jgi:hypothetical protein